MSSVEEYRRLALRDHAWDVKLGFNLAFYRNFAIARIGAVLASTGEVTQHPQQRADDTGLLMYELIYHGFEHPRGREAVRRLNQIHRRYRTGNEDYLYVLSGLVVVPTRWIDRHGRRPLTLAERKATADFYRELGRRMAIRDLPASYAEFEDFFDRYERTHLGPHPAAAALIDATRSLLAQRFPPWLRPVVRRASDALLDEPLRVALGLSRPPAPVRLAVAGLLRARRWVLRSLPPPRRLAFTPGQPTRSYPDGYTIAQLGPRR